MNYTIRKTKETDLPSILDLISAFHKEKLNDFGVYCDDIVAKELMPKLIPTSLVLEIDNKILGVIAGIVTSHIVSSDPLMQEVIWYVSKDYRRYGIRLYKEFEKWCTEIGMKHLVMVNMGGRDSTFKKFYENKGFRLLETQYIKALGG